MCHLQLKSQPDLPPKEKQNVNGWTQNMEKDRMTVFREHEIAAEFSCSVALNPKMFGPKILKQNL